MPDTPATPGPAAGLDLEFLYVGDPMCSWCWGFAPVLDQLREHYDIPLSVIVGGLAPGGGNRPSPAKLRAVLAEHWHHVEEASGQPFDFDALDRLPEDWVYDTEPGCRSVVAMRQLAPEHEFAWFTRLQRAFYADAIDVVDVHTHLDLLPSVAPDVDPERFLALVESDEVRRITRDDFGMAQAWGITGFPTLMVRVGEQVVVATQGWVPWEHLETQLTRWLHRQFPDHAESLIRAA